jgi:hypothetical protein
MAANQRIQRILLWVTMVLAFVPLLGFILKEPLTDPLTRGELRDFTTPLNRETWQNGTFQSGFEAYLNDYVGLFPFFVRIHNQLEYSLFNKVNTSGVVAGKNNYLYEKAYIDAYYGKDFIGSSKIKGFTRYFKALQDTLASMDKVLVYMVATGKASYYPEYIPYQLPQDSTNLEVFLHHFQKNNLNIINTVPWFLSMKDTLGHLLSPQFGVHWSYYGSALAVDTLVRFIEHKSNWDLPDFQITARPVSPQTRYFDNDIANAMNLLWEPQPDQPMVYPEIQWNTKGKVRKKALMISDSFGWDMFETQGLYGKCFDDFQFWFYYQTVHTQTMAEGRNPEGLPPLTRHVNLHQILMDYDVIVILSNEPNMAARTFGFVREAYESLKNPAYLREFRADDYLLENLKTRKGWREGIEEQAQKRGISVDSVTQLYLYDRNFEFK